MKSIKTSLILMILLACNLALFAAISAPERKVLLDFKVLFHYSPTSNIGDWFDPTDFISSHSSSESLPVINPYLHTKEDSDLRHQQEIPQDIKIFNKADLINQELQAIADVFGTYVGSFNNVNAYSNGATDYTSNQYNFYNNTNTGMKWQCVEYVQRYYLQIFGIDINPFMGNANSFYSNAAAAGLLSYPNDGSVAPQIGDIICSNGGLYGHVAIVREVNSNYINVIHQNWSNSSSDNSKTISRNGNIVSPFSPSYPIVGWLRNPSCSFTVGQGASGSELAVFQNAHTNAGGKATLGCPITAVASNGFTSFNGTVGHYQTFNNGAIEYHANGSYVGQAFALANPLYNKWSSLGFNADNPLGYPISDFSSTQYSSKGTSFQYQNYEGGALEYHISGPYNGQVFEIHGGIFNKWKSLGYAAHSLGLPIGDESEATSSPAGTTGRVSVFEGGHIHWHRNGTYAQQAFETHGPIDQLYAGTYGSGSWLGFPISDQIAGSNGFPRNDFEGGYITTPDGVNYYAYSTSAPLTISGYVRTSGGTGISGVVMNGLPGNPATNAQGQYTAAVNQGWTGTVTPTILGYMFTPANRTYTNITVNQTGQDYTAVVQPTITLTSPNGGESWAVGPSHNITWTTTGTVGNLKIEYSTNSGSSYSTIIASTANSGSYPWTIPSTPSTNCLVRISQVTGGTPVDTSDSIFTISASATIAVTSPNGGESWQVGTTHNIIWTSTGLAAAIGIQGNVTIDLFKGAVLQSNIGTAAATAGSYAWTIPSNQAEGPDYRIKISQGSVSDLSDGMFAILTAEPISITVTSPNGGESWAVGSSHNITWTSTGTITNVKIEYSTNSGSSYSTIIASTANSGSYPWTIPSTPSTNCLVRISQVTGGTPVDASNSIFTISDTATIAVTSPNGGESWQVGTTHNIIWTCTGLAAAIGIQGNVTIDLFKGAVLQSNIGTAAATAGSYAWTIPSNQAEGPDYRIKISQGAVSDLSDGMFAILTAEPISITVTSPNGGESWAVDSSNSITWTTTGTVGNLKIEYSTNGGTAWSTVITSTANTGTLPWTVPNTPSTQCLVKVSEALTGTRADISNAVFSIVSSSVTISGTVTAGGTALPNVAMNGLPGNPVTDASGAYSVNVNSGWSGTVIPNKAGYIFSPPNRSYSNVTANQSDQNYAGSGTSLTVTTTTVSSVTETNAVSGGNVTSDGGVSVTERGVCVSTSANPTLSNAHTHDGSGTGAFMSSLTGCTPGTTYHIQAYATNSVGTAYGGSDLTFTTLSLGAPTVTTTAISSLTKTSFMTGGNVTLGGSAAVTERGVCVSTALNPTIADVHTHNGAGTGVFVSSLTGGMPGETYHVRAYATSTAGTAYGNDIWFQTLGGSKSDFNADGQSDILWRNMTTGENAVWFMGYTATGVNNLQMRDLKTMFPGAGAVRETGDLFKGKPGIVYLDPREGMKNANLTSPPAISEEPMGARGLEMDPLTSFSSFQGGITILGLTRTSVISLPPFTDLNWVLAGTGDFNGDGWPDFVLRNMVTGENGIWYIVNGAKIGAEYMPSVLDLNWTIVGTGDFNGDKKPDLVWRNSATGDNYIWFMNGAGQFGGDTPPPVTDPNWTIVGTGDFNGDGKLDFLWHNVVTGENYIWFMDGATKIGGDSPPMVSDVNWQIGGVGDFNADGRPDILWRNYVSGENGVWYMNGALQIGAEYVPTIADVAWKIVNR